MVSTLSAASYPTPPVSLVLIAELACGGCSKSAYWRNRVGPLWCARHPGQSWLGVLSVVCVLCSPGHRHLTDGPLRSGSPLPKAIKMQQLGDRAKWLWKIAPKASYLRCVLFCFVFSICCCPRTKASATDQLHGEMAWPRAKVLHQVVEPRRLLHAMGR